MVDVIRLIPGLIRYRIDYLLWNNPDIAASFFYQHVGGFVYIPGNQFELCA